jgi:hypothetical protein
MNMHARGVSMVVIKSHERSKGIWYSVVWEPPVAPVAREVQRVLWAKIGAKLWRDAPLPVRCNKS